MPTTGSASSGLAWRTFSIEVIVLESETLKWICRKNGSSDFRSLLEQLLQADLRALEPQHGDAEQGEHQRRGPTARSRARAG